MTNKEIIELSKSMWEALDDYSPGHNNEEAKRFFMSFTNKLIFSLDVPTQIKSVSKTINEYAQILYSPRKHQNYGGIEKVKSIIYQDIAKIEKIINRYSDQ